MYFDEDVDQSLQLFKLEQDPLKKNLIFKEFVLPAFKKLAQYHYYRLPVARNTEVINDCISHLFNGINSWDGTKKGFPYFNMVAKNFFNQKLKQEKRQISNDQYVTSLSDYNNVRNLLDPCLVKEMDSELEESEMFTVLMQKFDTWKEYFNKEQEQKFLDALKIVFENRQNIICKKKAILFYIKEISGLSNRQISCNLNKIKKKFRYFKRQYNRGNI